MAPFLIFSLPRSRSTWLSVLLSHGDRVIGHDIGIESASPQDFLDRLAIAGGSCETGASFAWRKIRELAPDIRFVVVKKPAPDVIFSLETLGYVGLVDEMLKRERELEEISAQPGTLTVNARDLDDYAVCDRVHLFCLGEHLNYDWFEKMRHTNVQVDFRWNIERLRANQAQIEALKCAAMA